MRSLAGAGQMELGLVALGWAGLGRADWLAGWQSLPALFLFADRRASLTARARSAGCQLYKYSK